MLPLKLFAMFHMKSPKTLRIYTVQVIHMQSQLGKVLLRSIILCFFKDLSGVYHVETNFKSQNIILHVLSFINCPQNLTIYCFMRRWYIGFGLFSPRVGLLCFGLFTSLISLMVVLSLGLCWLSCFSSCPPSWFQHTFCTLSAYKVAYTSNCTLFISAAHISCKDININVNFICFNS